MISKKVFIGTILLLYILITGCTGCEDSVAGICGIAGDQAAHCIQKMAIESSNPALCDRIPVMSKFKDLGSNPPKDKCYLTIAEETGESSICDSIEGGMMSYTSTECYSSTAVKHENPDLCDGSTDELNCRTAVAKNDPEKKCGTGFEWSDSSQSCKKEVQKVCEADYDCDNDKICVNKICITPKDETCKENPYYAKCSGAKTLEKCSGKGEVITEECPMGCFEAGCRTTKGETDIPETETKTTTETQTKDASDSSDSSDGTSDAGKTTSDSDKGTSTTEKDTSGTVNTEPKTDVTKEPVKEPEKPASTEGTKETSDKEPITEKEPTKDTPKDPIKETDPTKDLINSDLASGKIDEALKNELLAIAEQLKKDGIFLTRSEYEELRNLKEFKRDPKNNVENMADKEIVARDFGDRWQSFKDFLNPFKRDSAEEKALDVQLRFYEKMLERQMEINNERESLGKQVWDNYQTYKNAKDVYEIIKLDPVAWATKPLEVAVESFQDGAKKAVFRQSVREYNQRMDGYVQGGMSVEQAHAIVSKELQEGADIGIDKTNVGLGSGTNINLFHGNDCANNPSKELCLSKSTFFKSMKKSYKYTRGMS